SEARSPPLDLVGSARTRDGSIGYGSASALDPLKIDHTAGIPEPWIAVRVLRVTYNREPGAVDRYSVSWGCYEPRGYEQLQVNNHPVMAGHLRLVRDRRSPPDSL